MLYMHWLIEQGLTSHQHIIGHIGDGLLRVKWPNQQCQRAEESNAYTLYMQYLQQLCVIDAGAGLNSLSSETGHVSRRHTSHNGPETEASQRWRNQRDVGDKFRCRLRAGRRDIWR